MNLKPLFAIPLVLSALCASAVGVSTFNYEFAENSRLTSGHWVRVSVDRTGIYEISYDRLRELGFSNPEKVGVFGCGGRMLGYNFTDGRGVRLMEDDLTGVSVAHGDGKLVFYGVGTENISFGKDRFQAAPMNIYTDKGHYMLGECEDIVSMMPMNYNPQLVTADMPIGLGYHYHELDLHQNNDHTGQMFYGEDCLESSRYSWAAPMPFAVPGEMLEVSLSAYIGGGASSTPVTVTAMLNYNVTYGQGKMSGLTSPVTVNVTGPGRYNFDSPSDMMGIKELSGQTNPVFSLHVTDISDAKVFAIDNCVITYGKSLSGVSPTRLTQETIRIPFAGGAEQQFSFPVPVGTDVYDVTNPETPLKVNVSGGKAYFPNDGRDHDFIVVNPERHYSVGDDATPILNQNLHAEAAKGCDFLIISVPEYIGEARQIAALHEKYDKIRVLVVDPQTVYNEFSWGNPDPMAYRALAKMLYQSPARKLKNVLLFGPVTGNLRGVGIVRPHQTRLIAYQQPLDLPSTEIPFAMDFYGMMADNIPSVKTMHDSRMEVGVGLLSVETPAEAHRAVSKVKEYMEETDWAWMVNESFSYSCPGDSHSHDEQACKIHDVIQKYSGGHHDTRFRHTTLRIDEHGYDKSRALCKKILESGKLFSIYYGHANAAFLTHQGYFMNSADFIGMKNRNMFFHFFAGCDLSFPDAGKKGLGELAVLGNPRGAIGSIASTRTVWSNQNYELSSRFINAMFNADGKKRTEVPTAGEVYAEAKTRNSNANELCFIYIGDPAVKMPVSVVGADLTVVGATAFRAGDVAVIEGRVKDFAGEYDEDFNGDVVIKLARPEYREVVFTRESNGSLESIYQYYDDTMISAVRGEVRRGYFKVKVPLSEECDRYLSAKGKNQNLQVYVGFYDRVRQLGGSGYTNLPMAMYDAPVDATVEKDVTDPDVKAEYDPWLDALRVVVSDDVAIMPGIGAGSGTRLKVDGHEVEISVKERYNESALKEYTALVPAMHLAEGEHTVTVSASDAAGNTTPEVSFKFVKKLSGSLRLEAGSEVAVDTMSFSMEGYPDGETMRFVVVDRHGNVKDSMDVRSARFSWEKMLLPAGTYRACVRSESAKGARLCSNWVEFSVID